MIKNLSIKLAFLLIILTVYSCKKEGQFVEPLSPAKLSVLKSSVKVSNFKTNNWMSMITDETSLAQLSIPGTHDSGALYETVEGTAQCQTLSIAKQLSYGVRFLDIRARHYYNAFTIHHGEVYQKQNFDGVLEACADFLEANPSETIIMSVKDEYEPGGNTRSYEKTFDAYVKKNPKLWYLEETIPNLGQVRGKIVLFRRFDAVNAKGLNIRTWIDNTIFTAQKGSTSISIQDKYVWKGKLIGSGDYSGKWTAISSYLDRAESSKNARNLFINFTSGYSEIPLLFGYSIPNITYISNYINPKVTSFFKSAKGHYGIIPVDFITSDIAYKIAYSNIY